MVERLKLLPFVNNTLSAYKDYKNWGQIYCIKGQSNNFRYSTEKHDYASRDKKIKYIYN